MKRYFLIFNPAGTSPPAITESKRAASYWEARGCEVEEFTRGDGLDALVKRFRLLVDDASMVVANWERGDLAGAVNTLRFDAEKARELLEQYGEART